MIGEMFFFQLVVLHNWKFLIAFLLQSSSIFTHLKDDDILCSFRSPRSTGPNFSHQYFMLKNLRVVRGPNFAAFVHRSVLAAARMDDFELFEEADFSH